jgi:uncharacterized iron-regulated protein
MKRSLPAAILIVICGAGASNTDERALNLPIGDPARSGREVPLVLDGVTDAATGDLLTPPELAARLDGVGVLFVGESHTDVEFHRVQLRVIQELQRRGRTVIVGLEMYPAGAQEWLDRWISDDTLTEEDFVERSHWYRSWGYHWNYYRDIFVFARHNRIRMVGVNVPRDIVQTVRREGFERLTPEQKALLPENVDTDSSEHERLFRAFFDEEDSLHGHMPEPMFRGMFRAQCTWDAAMGWNAVKALEASGAEDAIVVVLVGSGHVAYGLGAERQARLWFDGRTASLIPVPIADTDDPEPIESVQASYADFVWGLPPATDPLYPTLGVSTPERKRGDRYTVIMIAEGSVGAAAGFQVGDELVSMDGVPIDDKETSRRMMAEKRWGDMAVYEVLRDGAPVTLTVHFRREPPEPTPPETPPEADAAEPSHPPPHPPMPPHHGRPPAPEDEKAGSAAAASMAGASGERSSARPHHSLKVALDPATGRLRVVDLLTVPPGDAGDLQFLLSAALTLTGSAPEVTEVPLGDAVLFFGINASAPALAEGQVKRYRVPAPPSGGVVRLEYEGPFNFGLSDQKEEYTRGFRDTQGIVSSEGVYLAGSGFWYPQLGPGLMEFDVEVELPDGWHVISQGNGTSRDADGLARWDSHGPMDEIYLVGGPLEVYREAAGAVDALVYLRETDDALAARYLEATAQYLEMYRGLIGPYPYGKFALVENFWETGYGMPSFTLLGPRVIRFPFILASSYPHEILHNWWGNSVFVDYETGNWCEGLTAYMADNLIKEQRGQGAEYRRDTLQKYRSYVREGRDFPLTEFRSRHSAATEAVGYGKTMMGFHMLRRRLGDDTFREWAARFYRAQRGRRASFSDVRESLEAVFGEDLGRFFTDWVERAGAATLEVSVAGVRETPSDGWQVEGSLRQTQAAPPYLLDVPVVLQTEGPAVTAVVRTESPETGFVIGSELPPVALHVDPAFDVFRRLDPRETPPSIGQIFGEPSILAVLPTDASAAEIEGYRTLVEGWRSDSHQPEIVSDGELTALPADRAVWLLGRANALALSLFASADDISLGEEKLAVGGETVPLAGHAVVVVRRHPHDLDKAIGWIFADGVDALPGLGRKLPHYGKYSYLAFEGDEPTNVLKGQWTPADSPLRVDLRPESERRSALATLELPPREALAELPPVFSQKALMEHVNWLAAPEREGRGIGTAGLAAAADYIAEQFAWVSFRARTRSGRSSRRFSPPTTTTWAAAGRTCTPATKVGCIPGPTTTPAAWPSSSSSRGPWPRPAGPSERSSSSPSPARRPRCSAPATTSRAPFCPSTRSSASSTSTPWAASETGRSPSSRPAPLPSGLTSSGEQATSPASRAA